MSFENLTTYTEDDSGNRLTLSGNYKVIGDDMPNDEDFHLTEDYGAAYINGDFSIDFDANCTGVSNFGIYQPFALSSIAASYSEIETANGDSLLIRAFWINGDIGVQIISIEGGVISTSSSYVEVSDNSITKYYTFRRTGNTAYLDIYDDSDRLSLNTTLSRALGSALPFQFVQAIQGWGGGSSLQKMDGWTENIDLGIGVSMAISRRRMEDY